MKVLFRNSLGATRKMNSIAKHVNQSGLLSNYHQSQTNTLEDKLALVDENDKIVGVLDKKTCHLNSYNRDHGKPHRAFSLFMFNQCNQLLLHQRSKLKIAFPNAWTNSCCSHPAVSEKESGIYQYEEPSDAVIRRTKYELGVDIRDVTLSLVEKIIYRSEYDDNWGEHELDYVYLCKISPQTQLTITPNSEQISDLAWVSQKDLSAFISMVEKQGGYFSPWFKKISQQILPKWWNQIQLNNPAVFDKATVNSVINML